MALESLDVIGRRERMRDRTAARAEFERAFQIANERSLGVWRIKTLHELATIDMLADGEAGRLIEVRDLAHQAGIFSTATIIDLQLANLWSLGTDLDAALTAARQCERGATQISAHRVEAMAICVQALVFGIRSDAAAAEDAAVRAESILPDDPELSATTWGQIRVLASLFRDDLSRAVKDSDTGMSFGAEALNGPQRVRGFYSPAQVR